MRKIIVVFKFGFVGQGFHPCTPPKNFLKKVLWNLKNFQKLLINIVFESFRKSRNPFSKGFLVGCRGETPALQTQI